MAKRNLEEERQIEDWKKKIPGRRMMMMRTLMPEETMGSPAKVPFHAFMYPDFSLPSSLTMPCRGILLSPCHTKHTALSICRVTQAVKHKVPAAHTCMCTHTHAHTQWLVRRALWSCQLIQCPMAW